MKYHIFKRDGRFGVRYEGDDVDMQKGIIAELKGEILYSGSFDMRDKVNYFDLIKNDVLEWANETGEFDGGYIEYLVEVNQNNSQENF